jgi:hypothetical protein
MEQITRAAAHLRRHAEYLRKGGLWETPWMERVLPTVEAIVRRYSGQTIFSRFITPEHGRAPAGPMAALLSTLGESHAPESARR